MFSSMNIDYFYYQKIMGFKLCSRLGKLNRFMITSFRDQHRLKQMSPSVTVPLLTFSQLGITKAQGDRGYFFMKLYDNSRNLTDEQIFFPSGAFLNEMVA